MTYEYNDKVRFDLSDGFIYAKEKDDDGDVITRIKAGKYVDSDGEEQYRFSCSVTMNERSPSDFDEEVNPDNLLNQYLNRMSDPKYHILSGKPKTLLMDSIVETPVFFLTIRHFAFQAVVQLSDWSILELLSIEVFNDDEEDSEVISAFYDNMYEVLKAIHINGKQLPMSSFSRADMGQLLLPISVSKLTEDELSITAESDNNKEKEEKRYLENATVCGIWLMLSQITSLCRNTEYFTEDDIDIIEEGLTTHELIVALVFGRDQELYETALQSQSNAVSFIMGIPANDGKNAISVFERVNESALPPNFEKAFILISLFFNLPYDSAVSLPFERKQEIMRDCFGFVNSMQMIIAMQGIEYTLPDYCQASTVKVIQNDTQSTSESGSTTAVFVSASDSPVPTSVNDKRKDSKKQSSSPTIKKSQPSNSNISQPQMNDAELLEEYYKEYPHMRNADQIKEQYEQAKKSYKLKKMQTDGAWVGVFLGFVSAFCFIVCIVCFVTSNIGLGFLPLLGAVILGAGAFKFGSATYKVNKQKSEMEFYQQQVSIIDRTITFEQYKKNKKRNR